LAIHMAISNIMYFNKIYNVKLKLVNIIVINYLLLHNDKRFILSFFQKLGYILIFAKCE
jgi:hypothetical protein